MGGEDWRLPRRGDHILLESDEPSFGKMYAVGWADKKPKFLVVNAGTSHGAEPSVRMRHKRAVVNGAVTTVSWEKLVPRPEVIKQLFSTFFNHRCA